MLRDVHSKPGPCFYPSIARERRTAHAEAGGGVPVPTTRAIETTLPTNPGADRGETGGKLLRMEETAPPVSSLADARGREIRSGERCSLTPFPFPPRGSSGASLTLAWWSQQLENGEIGDDDVAFRHGFLQFHAPAAQGPAEMLLRGGARASCRPVTVPSDVTEAVARRPIQSRRVPSACCALLF